MHVRHSRRSDLTGPYRQWSMGDFMDVCGGRAERLVVHSIIRRAHRSATRWLSSPAATETRSERPPHPAEARNAGSEGAPLWRQGRQRALPRSRHGATHMEVHDRVVVYLFEGRACGKSQVSQSRLALALAPSPLIDARGPACAVQALRQRFTTRIRSSFFLVTLDAQV